ncbi:hypothetical protein PABG_11781 [Paracoccidioides brasiliensis Pb03]|nr:hypothetical protein PABG_11781 [Paracoccidioides brasiliensis Pb03]
MLKDLSTNPTTPVKVLVSGRREIDIIRLLKDQPKISTQGKDADENIHYYIRASVEGRPRLRKLKVVMQEHMVETLTQGAGGMFRWVKCQLDGLNRLSRVEKTYNLYPCTPTLPPSRSHRSSGAELDVLDKNGGMPMDLTRVAVAVGHEEVSRVFPEQRVIELRFHGDMMKVMTMGKCQGVR